MAEHSFLFSRPSTTLLTEPTGSFFLVYLLRYSKFCTVLVGGHGGTSGW